MLTRTQRVSWLEVALTEIVIREVGTGKAHSQINEEGSCLSPQAADCCSRLIIFVASLLHSVHSPAAHTPSCNRGQIQYTP